MKQPSFFSSASAIYSLFVWSIVPPNHTQTHTTFGRVPLDERSARHRDLYPTTHNTHKRQTSMPTARFEPAIPASEGQQTHALDRATTDTVWQHHYSITFSYTYASPFQHLRTSFPLPPSPSILHVSRRGFFLEIYIYHRYYQLINRFPQRMADVACKAPYISLDARVTHSHCSFISEGSLPHSNQIWKELAWQKKKKEFCGIFPLMSGLGRRLKIKVNNLRLYVSTCQCPRGLTRRSAAERLLGSWVRIPRGAWMFVSCTVFVLSGRGLCDGPIPRREESYRLWYVFECDQVKIKTLYTCCEQVCRRGRTTYFLRPKEEVRRDWNRLQLNETRSDV
jgi:hypothetical protein